MKLEVASATESIHSLLTERFQWPNFLKRTFLKVSLHVSLHVYLETCFAHNLFAFDFFFFCILKGVWLSAWSTEDLKIIGKNLTSINYGNLEKFLKFIDTIKYY